MSAFNVFAAALALLASANAYTTPTGDSPSGNAFSAPGLTSVVPVGQPYTVQWTPSTDGTVTLVLLKGESTNMQPVGPLVEKTANSGTYTWTPDTSLQPGPTETTGYGIQLIVDSTGQYQYTTQFGISNAGGKESSNSTSSASASDSASSMASTSTDASSTITSDSSAASATGMINSAPYANSTVVVAQSTGAAPTTLTSVAVASGASVTPTPTKSQSGSASAASSSSSSQSGMATALAGNFVGLIAAAGVAALAL